MLRSLRSAALVAVLALAAVPLAGCSDTLDKFDSVVSTVTGSTVPASYVSAARTTFNVSEAAATNYMRLPRCNGSNGPVCRDPAIRQCIDGYVLNGRAARNRLAALQRANPGGDVPVADYNTLSAASSAITSMTSAYTAVAGCNKG
jgi:hypothetical protein